MSEKFEIIGKDGETLFAADDSNFKNVLHIEGSEDGPGQVVINQVGKSGWAGDVYHGRTFEIGLPGCVKIEKLVDLIELYRSEIQECLNSYTEKLNEQGNYVGSFDSELTEPLRRNIKSDRSYSYEWIFEEAYDFLFEDHGLSGNLGACGYEKPKDGDYQNLANGIIYDTDTDETYLDFDADDLAEEIEANQGEIWE